MSGTSHHICTRDGKVSVGSTYTYVDSQARIQVEVLEDLSDARQIRLYLKQLPERPGASPHWQPFMVQGLRGNFEYHSAWRLYDEHSLPRD